MRASGAVVTDGKASGLLLDETNGAGLLDDVSDFVSRFVVFPEPAQLVAVTLWVVHTHAIEAAESTPRLVISSPEKRSGKTRLFEVFALPLCANPLHTENISTAALFRRIHTDQVTVLIDESDAIFGPRSRGKEDLRAVINTGHRRGGVVCRCCGTGYEVVEFQVFGAVALAGLPGLPDTILDRSIVISMKRRRADEAVDRLRLRRAAPEAQLLHDDLAAWVAPRIERLRDAEPEVPECLDDRAADGWEPLLALADLAGGAWPERARAAAIELSAARADQDEGVGVRLLADIRELFEKLAEHRVTGQALTKALYEQTDGPWAGKAGEALRGRELAALLRPFGIRPRSMRFGSQVLRGYERSDFTDAWARYLGPDK